MAEEKNRGVITIIEELIDDLKILVAEIEPLLSKQSIDLVTVKNHIDFLLTKMTNLTDKTNLTHRLILGVINSIHSSRKELKLSVDGLLKKTGMQLQRITATTEEATNKILDVAERLDEDQNRIIKSLDELKNITDRDELNQKIDQIKEMAHSNQESAFTIIDYLQFQDITAQQIAGAYSLLSDTEKTLLYVSNLLKEFDMGDNSPEFNLPEIDRKAFNADAAFTDKGNIQNLIDDLFETGNTDVDIPTENLNVAIKDLPVAHKNITKQEDEDFDIDALFNDKKKVEEDEDFDIDALFNNNNKDSEEKANQDDIDKLFS